MNVSPEKLNRIFYLCGALREEVISVEEFAELNQLLEADPFAQEIYLNYVYLCTDLCRLQAAIKHRPISETIEIAAAGQGPDLEMLKALGEYEKEADALEVPPQRQLPPIRSRMAAVETGPRQVSRLSIITLVTSLAALLLMVAYVHLNPQHSFEVAALSDAIDAQWSSSLPLRQGTRLAVSRDSIHLQKGILKFQTDEGVSVVLESPAEFRFTGPSEIMLQYGRLFAAVSDAPNGFSVQSANARIIDLGTEFGVYTDTRGQMELHVYKGKTALIADIENSRQVIDVNEGQARQLDNVGNEIRPIALDQNLFVRNIESDTGLIWRNDRHIDLSDIVGGGNGTGSGTRDRAIRWDGQKLLFKSEIPAISRLSQGYVPVTFSPFIDGIFIPHSKGEEPLTLVSEVFSLNLNEFIRRDTNGLITLMLLHDTDDIDANYWFRAKEGAEHAGQMPSLTFPNARGGRVRLTTADGDGADAFVANDILFSPESRQGKERNLSCRYFKDQRIRMIYLRFDLRGLEGDLSEAVLSLYLNSGNRQRALQVYGLNDGPADLWDESTICFNTAPALQPARLGNYRLDETACRSLGTFNVIDNRVSAEPIAVTANGHCRWIAPQTIGESAYAIGNTGAYSDRLNNGQIRNIQLADALCGTSDNPSILLHANAGITFDLEALRQAYGRNALKSFTAECGLSQSVMCSTPGGDTVMPRASFYVLLDGQEVFSAIDLSPLDTPQPMEIQLNRNCRYLTLVTTQGTDNSVDNDLCVFTKPMISFEDELAVKGN
jgi:hypothetical protein